MTRLRWAGCLTRPRAGMSGAAAVQAVAVVTATSRSSTAHRLNPELGQQWFSSTDGYLYIWFGAEWVAIGGTA